MSVQDHTKSYPVLSYYVFSCQDHLPAGEEKSIWETAKRKERAKIKVSKQLQQMVMERYEQAINCRTAPCLAMSIF